MASPSTVITLGYGNGTLAGSVSLIITLGFGIGQAAAPPQPLYRPRTAVGPDGYRPGGAIVAAGHRPLFARRGTEYRPGNPTSPGG